MRTTETTNLRILVMSKDPQPDSHKLTPAALTPSGTAVTSHEIKLSELRYGMAYPRVHIHSSLYFTGSISSSSVHHRRPTARMCEAFVRPPACVPVQPQPKGDPYGTHPSMHATPIVHSPKPSHTVTCSPTQPTITVEHSLADACRHEPRGSEAPPGRQTHHCYDDAFGT